MWRRIHPQLQIWVLQVPFARTEYLPLSSLGYFDCFILHYSYLVSIPLSSAWLESQWQNLGLCFQSTSDFYGITFSFSLSWLPSDLAGPLLSSGSSICLRRWVKLLRRYSRLSVFSCKRLLFPDSSPTYFSTPSFQSLWPFWLRWCGGWEYSIFLGGCVLDSFPQSWSSTSSSIPL